MPLSDIRNVNLLLHCQEKDSMVQHDMRTSSFISDKKGRIPSAARSSLVVLAATLLLSVTGFHLDVTPRPRIIILPPSDYGVPTAIHEGAELSDFQTKDASELEAASETMSKSAADALSADAAANEFSIPAREATREFSAPALSLSADMAAPAWLSEIQAYIAEHYSNQELNVSFLADQFHLTISHLSRTYKKLTGTALLDAIHLQRLTAAKSLLLDGSTVSAAAVQVGYLDARALTRAFKRYEGITPGQYAKAA